MVLFGKWKISRDFGLNFELETDGTRRQTLSFGGEYNFDDSRQMAINLSSSQGERLGVEVIFTQDFFGKDGQAFVRLQKSIEDSRVEAGVKLRW